VEITSRSNARYDRTAKKWAYAHGPVPLYLLVDPWDVDGPISTLFSHPLDGDHTTQVSVPFGQPIALPAPFDVEIGTAEFLRP
jgi:Putative restriction endonuclease